jgi:hypothetical protein
VVDKYSVVAVMVQHSLLQIIGEDYYTIIVSDYDAFDTSLRLFEINMDAMFEEHLAVV